MDMVDEECMVKRLMIAEPETDLGLCWQMETEENFDG